MRADVTLELTSADIPGALEAFSRTGVMISNIVHISDLTVRLTVRRQDISVLRAVTERRGEALKQIARIGTYWKYRTVYRHPVLIAGLLLMLALTMWLPTRVLFIRVEGNNEVPSRLVLEKAAQCGIGFGAQRSEVRSEKMKNALLDELPQLQWAGINTYGCVAVISVEERRVQEEPQPAKGGSVVAARDGIIREFTAVRGTALCRVGQAVRNGEVLISGYTDCGGVILSGSAEGEVFAETRRQITAVTDDSQAIRREMQYTETKFALILGKNRINFYQDSGILDTSCVKMYSEYYLTLPGGLQLPVVLVREDWIYYDVQTESVAPESAAQVLTEYARGYLLTQMVAGQILEVRETMEDFRLNADYICLEMIGQVRYEEITENYGENYGENS